MRTRRNSRGKQANQRRSLRMESLEDRRLLATLPYGATSQDTGEFLAGDVVVTLALPESIGVNNTEDWNDDYVADLKARVQEGVNWWKDTLRTYTDVHQLNFIFDFTYTDAPFDSTIEPIASISNQYTHYLREFLIETGFHDPNKTSSENIREFNNSQRMKHDADWAFTIFAANDENDSDKKFAVGGSFRQAFAFAGGRFFVMPASRPASTVAHELGHMFWARDEYIGGGSYLHRRGYYNAQNLNAANNPAPDFQQEVSIMASSTLLTAAYDTNVTSQSSREMLGWRDSDGDGIFDALDVPHQLTGYGEFDPETGKYRFVGNAKVGTFPNLNSSGYQNNITINTIDRVEYQIDDGPWMTQSSPGTSTIDLDFEIDLDDQVEHTIKIRTATINVFDDDLQTIEKRVAESNIFEGTTSRVTATTSPGVNGVVYQDVAKDGTRDLTDPAIEGWTVQLVDEHGAAINLQSTVDPDAFPLADDIANLTPGVTINAVGPNVASTAVVAVGSSLASTGSFLFAAKSTTAGSNMIEWQGDAIQLMATFEHPVSAVSIDVIADDDGDVGRIDAYDEDGNILGRSESQPLSRGETETLTIGQPGAVIKRIIAHGNKITGVLLDNLIIGASTTTQTGTQGQYTIPHLPAGDFTVEVVAQAGGQPVTPVDGSQDVTVADEQVVGNIDFGYDIPLGAPWQNQRDPLDVNDDDNVSPADILTIINELNSEGAHGLEPPEGGNDPPPYFDVNGDEIVSPLDALIIINHLNSVGGNTPTDEGDDGDTGGNPPQPLVAQGGSSQGEGEGTVESALRLPELISGFVGGVTPTAPESIESDSGPSAEAVEESELHDEAFWDDVLG